MSANLETITMSFNKLEWQPGLVNFASYDNSYSERSEARVALKLTLYVRRAINHPSYQRVVTTENVSGNGVCIISEVPLMIGSELQISGLRNQFAATAEVCHVSPARRGGWAIGLKFTSKTGRWVIN